MWDVNTLVKMGAGNRTGQGFCQLKHRVVEAKEVFPGPPARSHFWEGTFSKTTFLHEKDVHVRRDER